MKIKNKNRRLPDKNLSSSSAAKWLATNSLRGECRKTPDMETDKFIGAVLTVFLILIFVYVYSKEMFPLVALLAVLIFVLLLAEYMIQAIRRILH
jgi:hypothetical protein